MTAIVQKLGDDTSHDVKPDFESGKGYYWMKQIKEIQNHGTPVKHWPRRPPRTLAEQSFAEQVHRRLSRSTFVSISFDENGKIIREEQ